MKILWHSNSPFTPSGYGNQTDVVCRWLANHGHEMIVSAFYGLRGATLRLNNITILPGSMEQWGNDVILAHYDHYRPDVFFALMDSWVLEPRILDHLPASLWAPIDHTPIPAVVADRLQHVRWPVAMSRHGEREMRQAGLDPFYAPHMIETQVYKPADRSAARAAFGVKESRFMAATVAANKGYPARKSLDKLVKAWAHFLADHPDGLLYIGTGDGGGADDRHGARGNAQDLGSLLGKILRIDPRRSGGRSYTVPGSNPFVGRSGARAEIYAYGLRNPWRFSFDRKNGALSIGDVGQNAAEEINYAPRGQASGANYGWRPFEGDDRNFDEPAPGAVAPVITQRHDNSGFCSITGGVVVRDPGLPALRGRYVYGDFCDPSLWSARLAPGRATGVRRVAGTSVNAVSSFGEDARGRVYVTSLSGPVYRLAAR